MIRRTILGQLWTVAILTGVSVGGHLAGSNIARADCTCAGSSTGAHATALQSRNSKRNVWLEEASLRCQEGVYFLTIKGYKRMGTVIELADVSDEHCSGETPTIQLLSRVHKCDGKISTDQEYFTETFELERKSFEPERKDRARIKCVHLQLVRTCTPIPLSDSCQEKPCWVKFDPYTKHPASSCTPPCPAPAVAPSAVEAPHGAPHAAPSPMPTAPAAYIPGNPYPTATQQHPVRYEAETVPQSSEVPY